MKFVLYFVMKRFGFILYILLMLCANKVMALTYDTFESCFAYDLCRYIEAYSEVNKSKLPESWDDINLILDRPVDQIYKSILPTKRYAFLSGKVSLKPPCEGDLYVVARRPFRDIKLEMNFLGGISKGHKNLGRYIIYRSPEGAFLSKYVTEDYIQSVFRGFESLLPIPDNEPMRSHELKAIRNSILWWIFVVVLFVFFIWVCRRRFSSCGKSTLSASK